MSNFTQRVLSSIILIPLILLIIFKLPQQYFIALVVGVTIIGMLEFCAIARISKLFVLAPIIILATYSYYLFDVFLIFIVAIVFWLINSIIVISYPKFNFFTTHQFTKYVNGMLLFAPFAVAITLLQQSPQLLVLLLIIVISADSFAYFSGKIFGKHKLAAKLSGGKTIEGVIGGLIFAMLFASLYGYYIDILSPQLFTIILLTAIISIIGDLYQSIYKRLAGIKDSGSIIPGHGGIWDRIDALLAATPVFFFFVFLVGNI